MQWRNNHRGSRSEMVVVGWYYLKTKNSLVYFLFFFCRNNESSLYENANSIQSCKVRKDTLVHCQCKKQSKLYETSVSTGSELYSIYVYLYSKFNRQRDHKVLYKE